MKSSFYVYCVAFWCTSKSPTSSNGDFTMGHQSTDFPLPGNTAGTGFWEGVCERQILTGRDCRSFDYVGDDPPIGGIACFEIR